MTNLEWIAAGNTGCTFATLFARKPEQVRWTHITHEHYEKSQMTHHVMSLICSIEFPPDWTARMVREWCKKYDAIFEEDNTEEHVRLRYRNKGKLMESKASTSWVQYFGPDSHVETRRTPNPMIMYTRKLNPLGFYKQVGFTGILHLAHAFSKHLTDKMVNTLWKRSYEQVKKKLGQSPDLHQAAKVTWLKKDVE